MGKFTLKRWFTITTLSIAMAISPASSASQSLELSSEETRQTIELLQACHTLQDSCNKHVLSQITLITDQHDIIANQSMEIARLRSQDEPLKPWVLFGLGILVGGATAIILGK